MTTRLPRSQLVVPPSSGRIGRPDIFVVVLDAARSDAFGPAGGGAHTSLTPHTDRLAADGTTFTRGLAPAPWTGQSIPTPAHRPLPRGESGWRAWGSQLPDEVPTLAQLMAATGYHTVLWSQHNIYSGNRSLRRGFATFDEVPSDVLTSREQLPTAGQLFVDDRPTFALVHLLPPHGPYVPPAPFLGSLSAWYTGDFPVDGRRLSQASSPRGRRPTSDDIRFVRARYDENVRFADDLVGRLVGILRDSGRYDDALILVTSDHGEAFFEHGRFLHTRLLYDEFLHIPFVVKWPGSLTGYPARIDDVVSLADVAPTLADGLGLDLGPDVGFQGRTLLPMTLDDVPPSRIVFAETQGVASPSARPFPGVGGGRRRPQADLDRGHRRPRALRSDRRSRGAHADRPGAPPAHRLPSTGAGAAAPAERRHAGRARTAARAGARRAVHPPAAGTGLHPLAD